MLLELIAASAAVGIKTIEIPLLEEAAFRTTSDAKEFFNLIARDIVPHLGKKKIILSLECSLRAQELTQWLNRFNHPLLKVTYDTGNTAFLGRDPYTEIHTLAPWLINVHIKDRRRSGESVPLGEGDIDFEKTFDALTQINYSGDYILEPFMGDPQSSAQDRALCIQTYLEFLNTYHLSSLPTDRQARASGDPE